MTCDMAGIRNREAVFVESALRHSVAFSWEAKPAGSSLDRARLPSPLERRHQRLCERAPGAVANHAKRRDLHPVRPLRILTGSDIEMYAIVSTHGHDGRSFMIGAVNAAVAMGVGTASSATSLLFGHPSAAWAIEVGWWTGAVLIFGGAAYLLTKWWRSYGGRALLQSLPVQRWPDFKKWDEHDEFELYEAAALWFDAEPRMPMWWRARQRFRRWKPMIGAGVILAEPDGRGEISKIGTSVTPHTRIRRDELKRLAEKEGSKPLFLFPESPAWRERAFAMRQDTFVRSGHACHENLSRKPPPSARLRC
jgi:hypothetical protein